MVAEEWYYIPTHISEIMSTYTSDVPSAMASAAPFAFGTQAAEHVWGTAASPFEMGTTVTRLPAGSIPQSWEHSGAPSIADARADLPSEARTRAELEAIELREKFKLAIAKLQEHGIDVSAFGPQPAEPQPGQAPPESAQARNAKRAGSTPSPVPRRYVVATPPALKPNRYDEIEGEGFVETIRHDGTAAEVNSANLSATWALPAAAAVASCAVRSEIY